MSMRSLWTLAIGSAFAAHAQDDAVVGTYSDGFGTPPHATTELVLHADSTFQLTTVDPVFTLRYDRYTNTGRWVIADGLVVLNPGLEPVRPDVQLIASSTGASDSLTIVLDHTLNQLRNGVLEQGTPGAWDRMTVFVRRKGQYHHVVRQPVPRICAFTPRLKHQVVVGDGNTFRVPRTKVERIGILTDGFDDIVWMDVADPQADTFRIQVVQTIDAERTPRARPVLVKGDRAYYYMRKGRIDRSLTSLTRR